MPPPENERTYICSVVFLDIVQFSQQSNATQSAWRGALSALLDRCLRDLPTEHRVIVDTGDGAAIGFLWNPEEAFACTRRLLEALPEPRPFALRIGAHIGPLRVVRGMNGHPNIVGDGINAAQRVMSFACPNEILVSRSFHEAVIWLSAENATLFAPCGKQADKHGREHDLYRMSTPPSPSAGREEATPATASPMAPVAPGSPAAHTPARKFAYILAGGLLLAAGLGIGLGRFDSLAGKSKEATRAVPPLEPTTLPRTERAVEGTPRATPAAPAPAPRPSGRSPDHTPRTLPAGRHVLAPPAPGQSGERHSTTETAAAACPGCSCTDLMTRLSLGVPLDNEGRRYLEENCKK